MGTLVKPVVIELVRHTGQDINLNTGQCGSGAPTDSGVNLRIAHLSYIWCSLSFKMIGLLVALLLLCFLLIIRHLRRNYGQVEKCGVPAVIPPTFFFGSGPWNLHQINHSELDMERAQKYGRIYGFYDMSTPWLSIADPPLVKKILVKNFESFSSHQFVSSDQKMRTLEQANGQEWKAIVFILAGFETTASTLTSLSYCLAKNPDVLEKLVEEVDRVVEDSEGKIDQESIREMPYLEACIKETLRLLPPVFRTDRTCVKDWEEDRLFIPKGMNISVPVFAIHHDPSIWADPETFQPERFLKEQESSIQACSWLPFGGGPRQCIGERFAMVEMKIAMTKLLSKFRIEANERTKMELRKGDQFFLTYNQILVSIFPRRRSHH